MTAIRAGQITLSSHRAIEIGASLLAAVGSALRRTRSTLGRFADSGQLGPAAHVTTSRWTGGRI